MKESTKQRWSIAREPQDVLDEFCHEFKEVWASLITDKGAGRQAKNVTDRGLCQDTERIRLVLISLDSLVNAAYQYLDQYVAEHPPPWDSDSELTMLADILHELKHNISTTKAFSDFLMGDEARGESSMQDREFMMRGIQRIDFLVREAFPLISSRRNWLRELDLTPYHELFKSR